MIQLPQLCLTLNIHCCDKSPLPIESIYPGIQPVQPMWAFKKPFQLSMEDLLRARQEGSLSSWLEEQNYIVGDPSPPPQGILLY